MKEPRDVTIARAWAEINFHDRDIKLDGEPLSLPATLLTSAQAKSDKGLALGIATATLYLAPHRLAGEVLGGRFARVNLCPKATVGCRNPCIYLTGRGRFSSPQRARIARAVWYLLDGEGFAQTLHYELERFAASAKRKGYKRIGQRLNGTSDIRWYKRFPWLAGVSGVTPYDYTKQAVMLASDSPERKAGVHMTYSRSETNWRDCEAILDAGLGNVAVVLDMPRSAPMPKGILDGDLTDWRPGDAGPGRLVGLRAKGTNADKQRMRDSGFSIPPHALACYPRYHRHAVQG
mgnify:CR=1 FL=1